MSSPRATSCVVSKSKIVGRFLGYVEDNNKTVVRQLVLYYIFYIAYIGLSRIQQVYKNYIVITLLIIEYNIILFIQASLGEYG